MKIVVLDSYAANPGDLSWDFLNQFGEYEEYKWTKPEELIERAIGKDIIISNKMRMNDETLKVLSENGLKFIALLATGYDAIDVKAAAKYNVKVSNVPAYSTYMVAQHTFALILELFDRTSIHVDAVKNGEWSKSAAFSLYKDTLYELYGKTIGIVGYGRIGKRVAAIAKSFGMNVIVHTRSDVEDKSVKQTDLDTLLCESDIVTLHCPLTEKTRGMIGADELKKMKKTAYLINTSRGPVVNEKALTEALNSGKIAGAGLDVIETEPAKEDCEIIKAKNTVITPHIAWAGFETRKRLLEAVEENIRAFTAGRPRNLV